MYLSFIYLSKLLKHLVIYLFIYLPHKTAHYHKVKINVDVLCDLTGIFGCRIILSVDGCGDNVYNRTAFIIINCIMAASAGNKHHSSSFTY